MKLDERDLEYHDGQTKMVGLYCVPSDASGSLPGILVVHGAAGLNEQICQNARKLAAQGYAVLAADLWGERRILQRPPEFNGMIGLLAGDRDLWMSRLQAAHHTLTLQRQVNNARLGAVGYCFGGTSVLEYIRTGGDLHGVVSLHGGLDLVAGDWSGANAAARALICTGSADPMARPENLSRLQQAMSAIGIRWETDIYSHTRHAFTERDHPHTPPFAAYDTLADRRSWQSMSHFFEELFDKTSAAF